MLFLSLLLTSICLARCNEGICCQKTETFYRDMFFRFWLVKFDYCFVRNSLILERFDVFFYKRKSHLFLILLLVICWCKHVKDCAKQNKINTSTKFKCE